MKETGWLLFFYSVPARPVGNRMRVWRRLMKAGAVLLKGAAYVLPYSEEHYELFSWLVSEVAAMNGEAAFVRVGRIETMEDAEVRGAFSRQKEEAYRGIEGRLDSLRIKDKRAAAVLGKINREFVEVYRTDFFSSAAGAALGRRIKEVEEEAAGLTGKAAVQKEAQIRPRRVQDYRGRVWATRKRPFVDRMASAWLIRRFVDENAVFRFVDEIGGPSIGDAVAFDMMNGEFTHVGDICTFEVLVKSFGLKDRALKAVAEVVHELDVKDGRYNRPEAVGVEGILSGIRKTATDDMDGLTRGMAVFEMLYTSKR